MPERVAASRSAQGLPPKIVDPAVLAPVAAIFANMRRGRPKATSSTLTFTATSATPEVDRA